LPVFNVAIDCIESGCSFSLRAFAPGTVTEDGSTTIPATAGRFLATSTQADTCTGDQGTQFSRPLTGTIDLAVTGAQLVRGVSVPQRIGGTFTRVIPDAGYVPKVGDVVDEGTEVGCPGQTLIFTVDAPLEPSS